MSEAGLPITRPISVWNKPLDADWKSMFKALASGAKAGVLGNWEDLPGAGVDLVSSIGLKSTAGQRAYLLIRRALTAAIHELVDEVVPQFQRVDDDERRLVEEFDWTVEESHLSIDREFFERPADLLIVDALKPPLQELLVTLGLSSGRAEAVSNRLGTYFTYHLGREWREHPATYGLLREALEGPFAEAEDREQGWRLYNAWLQKRVAEPVFAETFSLRDVYIPLRGFWLNRERPEQGGENVVGLQAGRHSLKDDDGESEVGGERVAVYLHEEIEGWLDRATESPIRLLSGGPGSGKSTFARMLAARVSGKGQRRVL